MCAPLSTSDAISHQEYWEFRNSNWFYCFVSLILSIEFKFRGYRSCENNTHLIANGIAIWTFASFRQARSVPSLLTKHAISGKWLSRIRPIRWTIRKLSVDGCTTHGKHWVTPKSALEIRFLWFLWIYTPFWITKSGVKTSTFRATLSIFGNVSAVYGIREYWFPLPPRISIDVKTEVTNSQWNKIKPLNNSFKNFICITI